MKFAIKLEKMSLSSRFIPSVPKKLYIKYKLIYPINIL
jgi:hypothetical protein